MIIRQAQEQDFEAIAHLIVQQCAHPQTHCIHSDTDQGFQTTYDEIKKLHTQSGICFVIALQNDHCVGALGCEYEAFLGRGWLRGPFVDNTNSAWPDLATALLEKLMETLPTTIRRLDTFLNQANERGNQFYLQQEFEQIRHVHVYIAPPSPPNAQPSPHCGLLTPEHEADFIKLHNTIFPDTYADGQAILESLDTDHQVLVYTQDHHVLGYLYANHEEGNEGFVEFLGVQHDARNQGIGFQLLKSGLHWLFHEKSAPRVGLTVNDDNTNARTLYEKCGFRLEYTGLNTRKEW